MARRHDLAEMFRMCAPTFIYYYSSGDFCDCSRNLDRRWINVTMDRDSAVEGLARIKHTTPEKVGRNLFFRGIIY
jgi:hypothetical protein